MLFMMALGRGCAARGPALVALIPLLVEARMTRIRDVVGRELKWVQPRALHLEYELLADGRTVATLQFRSMFGSLATGKSGDGCWTFKRLGFLSTRVTIRACGLEDDLAVYRNNTWSDGGTLELPDGRRYRANVNFWTTRYELRNDADLPLLTFQFGGLLHFSSTVEVHEAAVSLSELPWLVMLGWYLTVMLQHDSAAAVG